MATKKKATKKRKPAAKKKAAPKRKTAKKKAAPKKKTAKRKPAKRKASKKKQFFKKENPALRAVDGIHQRQGVRGFCLVEILNKKIQRIVLAATYSRREQALLPSALKGLTSVFGMGTGVPPSQKPPRQYAVLFVFDQKRL